MSIPVSALGAVLAATIAGAISLLGLVMAKEQKVSEFRQQWIDGLRGDIASLIAHVAAMHGHLTTGSGAISDRWTKARDDYLGANRSVALIRLRLNPAEKPSKEVLSQVAALENELSRSSLPDSDQIDAVAKQLVEAARVVLKQEWMRVRRGELVYRTMTFAAAALVIVGGILLIYSRSS